MTASEALLALLMALRPFHADAETEDERRARMTIIRDAVVDASERATCTAGYADETCVAIWPESAERLAVLLVATGYAESAFARHVHEIRCGPKECDARVVKGAVVHRARSPWQLHQTLATRDEWPRIVGADAASTAAAAWGAAKVLSAGRNSCGTIAGALSRYATGRTCEWRGRRARVVMFEALAARAARMQRGDETCAGS